MLRVHPEMKRCARCEESLRGGDVLWRAVTRGVLMDHLWRLKGVSVQSYALHIMYYHSVPFD